MIELIKRLLTPPPSKDEFQEAQVSLLYGSIIVVIIFSLLIPLIFYIVEGSLEPESGFSALGIGVISAISFFLMRYRLFNLASIIFVMAIYGGLTVNIVATSGGLDSITVPLYMIVIILGALLLNQRGAIGTTALLLLTFIGLYLNAPETINFSTLVLNMLIFLLAGILLLAAPNILSSNLTRLQKANEELRTVTQQQEALVQERTRGLTLAFEVANNITRIRDLQELLESSVELIRAQFDLYYVQIYLTDATGDNLTLQAGTGAAGKELVQRGHRLPVGPGSINGGAASQKEPVVIPDTASNPQIFRSNPLLPETRSEMAVPLMVGNNVLGVLDLQSNVANTLNKSRVRTFQILANQLATAIENANLFTQVIQTQEMLSAQTQRLSRRNWEEYLGNLEDPDRLRAIYSIEGAENDLTAETIHDAMFTTQIKVAGESVGVIQIENSPDYQWTSEDAELVTAVALEVGQQVENLRLLHEAERYREEAETALRRLTRDNWQEYLTQKNTKGYFFNKGDVDLIDTGELGRSAWKTPLKIRGEEIGELAVRATETLDDESATLVKTVAERLGTHIENLRLTEQTEYALAQAQRQSNELEAINHVVTQTSQTPNIQEGVQFLADEILKTINVDQVGIAIHQGDDEFLTVVGIADKDPDRAAQGRGAQIPIKGNLLTQQVIETRQTVVVSDVFNNPLTEPVKDLMAANGFESLAVIPMPAGDEIIGTVGLASVNKNNPLSEDQIRFAETLVFQASTSFANIRLVEQLSEFLEETEQQAQRLALLNQMSSELNLVTTVQEVYETAAQQTADIFEADHVSVIRVLEVDDMAEVAFVSGLNNNMPTGYLINLNNDPIGKVIKENRLHIFPVAQEDNPIKTVMVAPISSGDAVIGSLTLGKKAEGSKFTTTDENLLLQVASMLSSVIENKKLLSETQRRAEKERLINGITQKIQNTVTVESALQIAIEELGKVFQAPYTQIELNTQPTNGQNGQQ